MEKKSERLEVRLGYKEKQDFTEACDLQGDTPSGAVRRFINGYVRRSDGDVIASALRGSAKRKLLPIMALAGLLAIFGFGIYAALGTLNQPTDTEIFAFRDLNHDGELDASEHNVPIAYGGENSVLRVLDLDTSGTISREEFVRKGSMVYVVAQSKDIKSEQGKSNSANLVQFEFKKETTISNTFIGATINANKLDRLVIWPLEGGPTVMEGRVKITTGMKEIELQSDKVITYK